MNLRSILRKMRVLDPFDIEDVDQAEAENVLRDHSAAMDRIRTMPASVRAAQGLLRESIAYSRSSSAVATNPDVLAGLVHDMKSAEPEHRKGRR
ncbi:hypothetical protein ACIPUD_10660 [Bradyrhizobium sp. CAR08]